MQWCFAQLVVKALLLCAFVLSAMSAMASETPERAQIAVSSGSSAKVGETGIVLGRAFIKRADGTLVLLRRGDEIRVSDQITTESNGHVHVRFVDEAFVSVRPNSVLDIERYDYDQSKPEESVVKFNLREGVARSISGRAAKAARERYRLNTPIAAIGVRGTDFVVSANSESISAKVYEGSIVLAPFSASCIAEALGPCVANAIEINTESSQLLAMELGGPVPELKSTSSLADNNEAQLVVDGDVASDTASASDNASAAADGSDAAKQNEVLLEGTTTAAVTTDANNAAQASVKVQPETVDVIEEPELIDLTPKNPLTAMDLKERQLVWGRYSFAGLPDENDFIALAFAQASEGKENTIGDLRYGLFRTPKTPARIESNLGVVGFNLSSAQAVFNSNTGVALMKVTGGNLNIDFNQSLFATELNLAHDLTGQVNIIGAGRLFDGGFFRAVDATQTIRGAVSYDGSEAGYLFEKQLSEGSVSGLTLWDSK